LLFEFRRLEARGEIRGGRFVAGLSGEQFALTEAVGLLRKVRRRKKDGVMVSVSGADPLNLVGIVVPGPRVPALTGNRVLFRDGVAIASQVGKQVSFRVELDDTTRWHAHNSLIKRAAVPHLGTH
jgi:ATP-dependent Lhr-like helicase